MRSLTLIIVTDRNDLDRELFHQFANAPNVLKEIPREDKGTPTVNLPGSRPHGVEGISTRRAPPAAECQLQNTCLSTPLPLLPILGKRVFGCQ